MGTRSLRQRSHIVRMRSMFSARRGSPPNRLTTLAVGSDDRKYSRMCGQSHQVGKIIVEHGTPSFRLSGLSIAGDKGLGTCHIVRDRNDRRTVPLSALHTFDETAQVRA